ncbi:SAICAR synthase-like protein [Nemania sp. NC0429]|nr:SAICAR synthase-like protein [Nemania sp. NC0429]
MARRKVLIARSIVYAILTSLPDGNPARKPSCLSRTCRLFRLFWLTFRLLRPDLFRSLRRVWEIREEDYKASFGAEKTDDGNNNSHDGNDDAPGHNSSKKKKRRRARKTDVLHAMGDMGYSGSTFFHTSDGAYLVKSIPRRFEHDFFKNELLLPYAEHMQANPESLLVRITDLLERAHSSIGVLLGLAPSHHIVMENILYGQDQGQQEQRSEEEGEEGDGGGSRRKRKRKWESWDLKPMSFFYPERDVAGGALATEATKSKLADEFHGKIRLARADAARFLEVLEEDTRFLAAQNAVDYSLFLVRISAADEESSPAPRPPSEPGQEVTDEPLPLPPAQPPFSPPDPPSWRTGFPSSDGREVYRAAILDFFWAKHTLHAKIMTGLVRGYNLIDEQGPMSITAESEEYRRRFLEMCMGFVEIGE